MLLSWLFDLFILFFFYFILFFFFFHLSRDIKKGLH